VHPDLERVVLLAHSSKPFGDARMEILRAGRGHTANYLTLLQHVDEGLLGSRAVIRQKHRRTFCLIRAFRTSSFTATRDFHVERL